MLADVPGASSRCLPGPEPGPPRAACALWRRALATWMRGSGELHAAVRDDPDPQRHQMQLNRTAEPYVLEATIASELCAGMRPAGLGGFFQSAKHRAEQKQHAVVGQFANEVPSSIAPARKAFQMHRGEGPAYQGHQQATSAFRRDLERSGHL
ncbi:unnamed protein product [Durusdinium trenchii]|uniref:Uncharacterized protein n=1 Tax=Durusdinium trenchii TaxID=1381693 RepID=A0ABP0JBW6_9DINO